MGAHSRQQGSKHLSLFGSEVLHRSFPDLARDRKNLLKGRLCVRGKPNNFGTPIRWIWLPSDKAPTFQSVEEGDERHRLDIHLSREGCLAGGWVEGDIGQRAGLPGGQTQAGILKSSIDLDAQKSRGID
jgi:hypothetical protein